MPCRNAAPPSIEARDKPVTVRMLRQRLASVYARAVGMEAAAAARLAFSGIW
jgi:hypothetical protein